MQEKLPMILDVVRIGAIVVVVALVAAQVALAKRPKQASALGAHALIGVVAFVATLLVWWTVSVPAVVTAVTMGVVAPLVTVHLRRRRWQQVLRRI